MNAQSLKNRQMLSPSVFHTFADVLPYSVILYELVSIEEVDFKYLYVNDKACEFTGFDLKQFIGKNLRDVAPPAYEGAAVFPSALLKALETKQTIKLPLETYVDAKVGAKVYQTAAVYVQEGIVALVAQSANEVSSLTHELSIQKQLLELGEDIGQLSTWIHNSKTEELNYTQSFLNLLHLKVDDLNPSTAIQQIDKRIHPDDLDKVKAFRAAVPVSESKSVKYRYRLDDSTVIWLQDTLARSISEDKHLGITQDITDRQSENQSREILLQEKMTFLDRIMHTSPDVIYIYDLVERRNIFSNKSLHEICGYSPADLQEMGDEIFQKTVYPEDLEKMANHYAQVLPNLSENQVVKIDLRLLQRSGKGYRWFETTEAIFERDEDGSVRSVIGLGRDIHAQKEAELQVRETNKELERLLYSVSHDLRAPVRHIESYTEWIREDEPLSDEGMKSLNKVTSATQRLGSMIDELLQYSRSRNAKIVKTSVDMHALVLKVIEQFRQNPNGRTIQVEVDPLPECVADKVMMTQVWENLISNAIKFSSKQPETIIRIQLEADQTNYIFSIQDNGVGFNPKYADKLFAVFQSLHKRTEFPGHGIGLANVKRMISRHGGEIWAESTPGEGACIYFSLPK